MKKIYLLQGLPASGKSTWARSQVESNPGKYTRVNKDDLRAMMHQSRWSKPNEKIVLAARDTIIIAALEAGQHVIVDDTNFAPFHAQRMHEIAKEHGAEVRIKLFEIDVEEAIKRDLNRERSVGAKVIRDMYKSHLAPDPVLYVPPASKPQAIIVDIDGTLAHMVDRKPYDWDRVDTDKVDEVVAGLISDLFGSYDIILMSGRDSASRELTEQWLDKHDIPYEGLFMRAEGDQRKDSIVKRELFDEHVRDHYQVAFVLDDRNQVVDMWRNELGLKCLQVQEGDF